MKPLTLALSAGLIGGLIASGAMVLIQRWLMPAPALVTVRVDELLAAQVQGLSAQLDDPAQRAIAAERFARALDEELDRTAQGYDAVVFAGGAVLRGAPDLTDTLRARLDARLTANGKPAP